jgi:hypothetical protein
MEVVVSRGEDVRGKSDCRTIEEPRRRKRMKMNKAALALLLSIVALPAIGGAKPTQTRIVEAPATSKNPVVRFFHHWVGHRQ